MHGSLLTVPDKDEIDKVIKKLNNKAKLAKAVEARRCGLSGINNDRRSDGTTPHVNQPHLINQILDDLRMNDNKVKLRSRPADA